MQSGMESTGHAGSTSYMVVAVIIAIIITSAFIGGVIYLPIYLFFFFKKKEKSVPGLAKQATWGGWSRRSEWPPALLHRFVGDSEHA